MEQGLPTQALPPRRSSVFKKLLKWLLYLFVFFILCIGGLLALLFVYEDEVKAAVVGELNKHLKAEVKIDPKNIDLTIVSSFPDCSIEFKNMLMLEALLVKQRDTLLFAGRLSLYFNVADLWNKNYEIKSIKLKDAVAKPVVLKNGRNNYTFWESDARAGPQKSDSIRFNLKRLEIENCRLEYKDKKALFKTGLDIKSLVFKGSFSQQAFEMESAGRVLIKHITQQKTSMLREKELEFALSLDVNGDRYRFKKASISLNRLALELDGGFIYHDSIRALDVNYKAPDLDIASLLSLLPASYKDKMNDYESEGNFYAKGNLKYNGPGRFNVETSFGIRNGQIIYKPQSTRATGVNIEGRLSYRNSFSELELKNVALKLNQDEIKGSCTIRNFNDPYIDVKAQAGLNLQNLQSFWPIDTLEKLQGRLTLRLAVEGSLADLKKKTFSDKVKLDLDANVSGLEAQFKGDEKIYAIENCSITAKEREVEVHDLKLRRGSSDLKLNGKIPGMFNYLADRTAPLIIQGNLYSEHIQLEDFVPSKGQPGPGSDKPIIPGGVELRLNAAILKLDYAKFSAQNMTGQLEVRGQKAMVNDMKLETMQGNASISAVADNSKGKLDVILQSSLKGINISQLFAQLNNFGQDALQDKNLKGYASAEIEFTGTWNNRLEADYNSLTAHCDLNIDKGELIDYKPLLSLSKYLDIKDLQHIKFSSLQSSVDIKNKTIYIPRTAIKNSALNLDLSGSHSFDNIIDYHLRLLISDWRAKKRKDRDSEFGLIEKDLENKRSVYIKMSGSIDNPKIEYDFRGLKEKIGDDMKEEGRSFKRLMKEEFGLFKKDTLLKAPKKQQEQVFELEEPAGPQKPGGPKKKEEDDEDF